MNTMTTRNCLWAVVSISIALASANAAAQASKPLAVDKARVVAFWTAERRAAAIPRDLVIDPRGLGYMRRPDGALIPYGHRVEAEEPRRNPTPSPFAKPGGGTGGGGATNVKNTEWTAGGAVQKAAGRLLFEMAGGYYVCSGTVATDEARGRSVIVTAAHCVYDDVNKAFASYVMFIPDQAHTTRRSKTDFDCLNDPMGCWTPSFGVVDVNWASYVFPANIEWDYAFYVVSDEGAHEGTAVTSTALDVTAGSLPIKFTAPDHDVSNSSVDFTHALGYSYRYDPKFMYCAEDMTTNGAVNWWLPNCGLTGGSSGGPWVQPMNTSTGSGDIISVNSWGYIGGPGMAGPKLVGTTAERIFCVARKSEPSSDPRGIVVAGPLGGCH